MSARKKPWEMLRCSHCGFIDNKTQHRGDCPFAADVTAIEVALHGIAAECAKEWPEHRCFHRLATRRDYNERRCACGKTTLLCPFVVDVQMHAAWIRWRYDQSEWRASTQRGLRP